MAPRRPLSCVKMFPTKKCKQKQLCIFYIRGSRLSHRPKNSSGPFKEQINGLCGKRTWRSNSYPIDAHLSTQAQNNTYVTELTCTGIKRSQFLGGDHAFLCIIYRLSGASGIYTCSTCTQVLKDSCEWLQIRTCSMHIHLTSRETLLPVVWHHHWRAYCTTECTWTMHGMLAHLTHSGHTMTPLWQLVQTFRRQDITTPWLHPTSSKSHWTRSDIRT